MSTSSNAIKQLTLDQRFRLRNSNTAWVVCTVSIALLLSIPVITVLYSLFLPSSDVWQHLKSTVLASYATNSLLLVIGVTIGTSLIGISTAWLCSVLIFLDEKFLVGRYCSPSPFLPTSLPIHIPACLISLALCKVSCVNYLIGSMVTIGSPKFVH